MGPASVGLSGFALFESWQALNATAIATTLATVEILCDIKHPQTGKHRARPIGGTQARATGRISDYRVK
jgi:hypothetical protein